MAKRLSDIESSGSSAHTLLSNIYADAERWKDVTKVRRRMRDLGCQGAVQFRSVAGIAHEFHGKRILRCSKLIYDELMYMLSQMKIWI